MKTKHNVKWVARLNNNSLCVEGVDLFSEVENELSPYQKLKQYLSERDLKIVSFSLSTEDGQQWTLPSIDSSRMPQFDPFRTSSRPNEYALKRFLGQNMTSNSSKIGDDELYTVACAIYDDYELQIWVNENNTQESFTVIERNNGR